MRRVTLVALLVQAGVSMFAAAQSLTFSHFTVEDGLSNGVVNAIWQDSRGFVWIGTANGLNRYQELAEALEDGADVRPILADLKQNTEKISQHGQRAVAIVRSMMQHARGGTGKRERVDLNALVEATS